MYDPVCIYTQIYIYIYVSMYVWVCGCVYVPNSSIFSFTTTPLCYRWWNIQPGTLLRIIISCYFTANTNPIPGRRCRRVSRQGKRKNFRPRRNVYAYYTIAAVIDLDKTSYICTLYFVKCIFPLLSFVSSVVEKIYWRFLTKKKKLGAYTYIYLMCACVCVLEGSSHMRYPRL